MNLSKVQKVILGIFTFLPFVLFPLLLLRIFAIVGETMLFDGGHDREDLVIPVLSFIIPIVITALGSLALLIFYIVHVILNKTLEGAEQILWILLFIFIGVFAFPAYWVIRIWNNPKNP
jgi:hypothetical protein